MNGRRRWRSCAWRSERTHSRCTTRSHRRSVTRARRTTCGYRRRMASRASKCSFTAFQAAHSRPGSMSRHRRRSHGCTGSIPARTIFAEQSEEAIAAGAFHNDVVAVANERVLFAHEKAFADKQRADRAMLGIGARASNMSRCRRPRCRSPMRCAPICSMRSW